MKSLKNWILAILAAILFGLGVWLVIKSNQDTPFKHVTFTDNNFVHNKTKVNYLDTLVLAGLHELNIKNKSILILPLNKSEFGDINVKAHIRQVDSGYIIWIDEMSRQTNFTVIAHELIHLQQYESNTLVMAGNVGIMYNGIIYDINNMPPYDERPWEQEAFQKQDELMRKMLTILW